MIHVGDCREILRTLPAESVQTCVKSPPYYGLRDYGVDGQLGLEETPELFIAGMVAVFREVRRVLRDDGTLWLNIGDSYAAQRGGSHQPAETLAGGIGGKTADGESVNRGRMAGKNPTRNASAIGLKHKDMIDIPWMLAFALRADGWYLRQDIIWHKPNPMPESVRDRCTKAHEYLFLLSKSPIYFCDMKSIEEASVRPEGPGNIEPTDAVPGLAEHNNRSGLHHIGARETRNKRSVWTVPTKAFREAHFATYPEELIEPCILAGSRPGDTVLDPFMGAGTTAVVAEKYGRQWVGCEINPAYAGIAMARIRGTSMGLAL